METTKEVTRNENPIDFKFFYPLVSLKRKLTPYQKKAYQAIIDEGGKITTWPNLTATFELMEKKGIPLKFTKLTDTVPLTDTRTMVELVYPNFL